MKKDMQQYGREEQAATALSFQTSSYPVLPIWHVRRINDAREEGLN